jgi:hypothetical protein
MFFVSNLLSSPQAGRRGFESPVHRSAKINNLRDTRFTLCSLRNYVKNNPSGKIGQAALAAVAFVVSCVT